MKPRFGLLFLAATLAAQTPVRVEDSDPAVIKNGTWETVTDPAASGGTFIRTTNAAAGSSITLRFTGDTIRIFRQVLNSGGQAAVTVDGRPWGTLRFDFAETRMGAPAVFDGLGTGPHELVMTVSPSRPIFTQQDPVSISFDAFETPVAFTPTADQTLAMARYNQIRAAAGYPAARLSLPLSLAAQSYSDYMTLNNRVGLSEANNGLPGSTGQFGSDRLKYIGYPGTAYESLAGLGDPVAAVESWMGSIRDRLAMMSPGATEVGYGVSRLANRLGDTMYFKIQDSPRPAARVIVPYPANNQTGVPTIGNNNARIAPNALGFPISLHIQSVPGGQQRRDPFTGTLTGPNNTVIPVTLVSEANYVQIRDGNTVFMVPNAPLAAGTTYTARMTGSDGSLIPYEVTWSFTTASNAGIVDPRVIEATATSVTIQWSTLGTVASTSLQYGLTPAYGLVAPAAFNNDPAKPNQWAVRITGLAGNTQYNYRISASDAAGTQTTSNLIFTSPPAAQPVLYPGSVLAIGTFRWTQQGDGMAIAQGAGTSLILNDLNGGNLVTGDPVTLQVTGGRFITVGAGDLLQATAGAPGPNETFTIEFLSGARFKAANGRYVSAPQAPGPLVANALQAGATETFLLGGSGAPPVTIATSATFVKGDALARGNWKGAYGADGHHVIGETAALPVYVAVTPSGQLPFTWTGSTEDPRVLLKPASAFDRNSSCWYSGTSLNVELNFNDGVPHQVAIYLLDFDRQNRAQRVDVLDAGGAVLDTRNVTNFQDGQYLVWNLAGRVTLRFTNTGAANLNAVLTELFFGPGGAATFLGRRTDLQGNWQGQYGSEGYEVLGDSARIPAYASVTPVGVKSFVWTNITTDPRAAQRALSTANRTAAVWYDENAFSVDVVFNDAQPHQLTAYLCDWDSAGRKQRVELVNSEGGVLDTQDIENFQTGVYLSWTVRGRVSIRVTNTGGPGVNAVLQALFFGPGGPAPALLGVPAGRWQLIDGILARATAAADGTFFGSTESTALFLRTSSGWRQAPGAATLVAAASANRIWVSVGTQCFVGDGIGGWTTVDNPPGATFVNLAAGSDGTVMAIDTQSRIHRRDAITGVWSIVPPLADTQPVRLAARNAGEFYYLTSANFIVKNWGGVYNYLPGLLTDITVSAAGELWGVSNSVLWRFTGNDWVALPGPALLNQVVVGNGYTIYGLTQAPAGEGNIYRFQ